jgi:ribonuclease HII
MAEKRKLTTDELSRIARFRTTSGSARPVYLTSSNTALVSDRTSESSLFASPKSETSTIPIGTSEVVKPKVSKPNTFDLSLPQIECEYTVGIDEAGRGCILGPMFAGIVVWKTSKLEELRKMGVKDSKKLTRKRLGELHRLIMEAAEHAEAVNFTAEQLNRMKEDVDNPQTMNTMDEMLFARALDSLPQRFVDQEKPKLALFLDAADQIQERFGKSVVLRVSEDRQKMFGRVVSEHKADDKYPIVSAASIIAKFAREKWCEETHSRYGEFDSRNFGKGYCNVQTLSWLKAYRIRHGAFPDICRKWKPCEKIEQDIALGQ